VRAAAAVRRARFAVVAGRGVGGGGQVVRGRACSVHVRRENEDYGELLFHRGNCFAE